MSTPRFYCDPAILNALSISGEIKLPESAATHATRALRLNIGDDVTLFNGDGNDYSAQLTVVKKNEVRAKINRLTPVKNETSISIHLAQAISSGDRMDFTIQKAVEMGVASIQPITSQRSVVKLSGERAEKRTSHWQNVAISACEQCGRATVPVVKAPLSLSQWLSTINSSELLITLAPNAGLSLKNIPAPKTDIHLLIGAEGGLTDDEIKLSIQQGFKAIRLGKRILRTETAPLAAIAAMQTLWGDFCE
jgi:16S rRNA (uracil1498-N3)-methyltransferase